MTSTFLAQLFGIYFIIVGVIVLIRRKALMPTVKAFAGSRALLMIIAIIEIVAGLAVILTLPDVSMSVDGIIAVVGYMMVIEGIIYLAAPAKFIQKFIRFFNTTAWYVVGGIVAVVAGIYLAGVGFGLF